MVTYFNLSKIENDYLVFPTLLFQVVLANDIHFCQKMAVSAKITGCLLAPSIYI